LTSLSAETNIENVMINGSCLCGSVKYEISGKVGDIVHCHCKTCRKAQDSDFNLLSKDSLKSFELSVGKHRYFCLNCGTQVYAKRDETSHVILRLGSLDSKINSLEKAHIWVLEQAYLLKLVSYKILNPVRAVKL
jgi:hypothetical protein